jgi:hypothetical protein
MGRRAPRLDTQKTQTAFSNISEPVLPRDERRKEAERLTQRVPGEGKMFGKSFFLVHSCQSQKKERERETHTYTHTHMEDKHKHHFQNILSLSLSLFLFLTCTVVHFLKGCKVQDAA